ncbi:ABC transporter ATP-binding protein [Alphaproteobacteria bacterium]|nr:ABC transporter ATP-binding protein [Alphaproteobacteria bacterium]
MSAPKVRRLINVDGLTVEFATRDGFVMAVKDVSFKLDAGETLGIVGESGSGKSVTSYALMRILDDNGRIEKGDIAYTGIDLVTADERAMRDIRGREISMIFQNPRSALNPIRKVGKQIADVLRQHGVAAGAAANIMAIEFLDTVRIREPEKCFHAYPHELSGGMCQRVVIALALACEPRVLIADEPTTGLDVTTQKTILDLVRDLTAARGMSMVLITHDLGLAAEYCDRLIVMKSGVVVEAASAKQLFRNPAHPYTQALIRATPRREANLRSLLPADDVRRDAPAPAPEVPGADEAPLISVSGLTKSFVPTPSSLPFFKKRSLDDAPPPAVDQISFDIWRGESVGLVGESGCGKSTTSLLLMRLLDPTAGKIIFEGENIALTPSAKFPRSPHRPKLQMVFQDPTDCLNPRFTAKQCIADPIARLSGISGRKAIGKRVEELADNVRLPRALLDRFPHQLSGGQKARVGIARAIALNPSFLVLDEPTAALDVSVQAVVLNLLADLRQELKLTYLFVSHDLTVVRLLCNRVIVMRAGKIEETGETEALMNNPKSPYTAGLLAASPVPPAALI